MTETTGIQCNTLGQIINVATSTRKNSQETIIATLIDLFNQSSNTNYYTSRVHGRLKNDSEHGKKDLQEMLGNNNFKNFIIAYSKNNHILELAIDQEFITILAQKFGISITTSEDLIAYYINHNNKSHQPLIDFGLQYPACIRGSNIITQNHDGSISVQWSDRLTLSYIQDENGEFKLGENIIKN